MKTLRILPPIILLFCFLTSLGLHFLLVEKITWRLENRAAGTIFFTGGFALMARARRLFQRCQTPVKPTQMPTVLVTDGPYRITRNPMYMGFVIMLLGAALVVETLPMFFAPVAFFLFIRWMSIPYEEERMERIFGQGYLDYKKRVRRWL